MSSVRLAFSSNHEAGVVSLGSLAAGSRGVVVEVRAGRLLVMGVTPGALVTVLQTFPGVVFLCDQTELAVERAVADAVFVRPGGDEERRS
jgi:Fe2+ transport system protein FeoA